MVFAQKCDKYHCAEIHISLGESLNTCHTPPVWPWVSDGHLVSLPHPLELLARNVYHHNFFTVLLIPGDKERASPSLATLGHLPTMVCSSEDRPSVVVGLLWAWGAFPGALFAPVSSPLDRLWVPIVWTSRGSPEVKSLSLDHTVGSGQVSMSLRPGSEAPAGRHWVRMPPLNQELRVYYHI